MLALFENFEAKLANNGLKNQKNLFSICVFDFNFAPKISQICCTLLRIPLTIAAFDCGKFIYMNKDSTLLNVQCQKSHQ